MKKLHMAICVTAKMTAVMFAILMFMYLLVGLNNMGSPFLLEQQVNIVRNWTCEVFRIFVVSFILLAVLLMFDTQR